VSRVLALLSVAAIALVGLFPGLVPRAAFAPLPCCSPTSSFQTTFAMAESEIVFIDDRASDEDKVRIGRLEVQIEKLRRRLQIPGLSAAVVKDRSLLWARGFGCADIASGKPATPHTPYNLASLTKPFGATVLLQLVEKGLVGLDDPIEQYGITVASRGTVLVKHLLSHTSHGVPGRSYSYNGDRFGLIDRVIESASGLSFRDLLLERIVGPLGMTDTMPMPVHGDTVTYERGEGDPAYQGVWDRLAIPYSLVRGYGNVVGEYVSYFGAAAGLISSVVDYAIFDAALDTHTLLSEATQALAWSPFRSNSGRALPYGYGWFVQVRHGVRYLWHYGYWDCTSTLIVKVPERGLTFLLFANSDRLSSLFHLGVDANVRRSPAARAFLDIFIE